MGLYTIARAARWRAVNYPAVKCARFLDESERWSRSQIVDYRNAKLRKLIAHCYENVPYYRMMMDERRIGPGDIQRAEDMASWPILTKDTIRQNATDLMARNKSQMVVSWSKTGGTTGEPMRICKDRECSAWSNMCHERGVGWGGRTADEPMIRLSGGSLGIDKQRFASQVGNLIRGDLFIPAFELRLDNALSCFEKIRRSKCRFVVGYASAIYRLAVLATELDQEPKFTAVFPTAELMLPEWEETIRKQFKCSILPYYGCGEVNSLGFSAPEASGYLIPEEHALLETVPGDSAAQLYGEGRFLITDLDNYAMPIIRYANGDAGKISGPNGRFPYSRIERLDGRYNSLLMTDSGDLISGVIGTHVFRHTLSVKSYRIIQEEPLRIRIKVVPKGEDLGEEDKRLIFGLFTKYLGNKMKIIIEKVPSLPVPPSGKSVFVVNHCLQ